MSAVPSRDERFTALFNAHHTDIQAYCLRRLSPDEANDAAAEVFLVAWRRGFDGPQAETLMWLYGVARNVVRNHQRAGRRKVRLVSRANSMGRSPQDGPDVEVIRNEEHEEVLEALSTLRDTDRELIQLKVWEGLSNDEVGNVLGLSRRAVEGRYTRAIKKLSKHMGSGDTVATGSPFSAERRGATE